MWRAYNIKRPYRQGTQMNQIHSRFIEWVDFNGAQIGKALIFINSSVLLGSASSLMSTLADLCKSRSFPFTFIDVIWVTTIHLWILQSPVWSYVKLSSHDKYSYVFYFGLTPEPWF